MIDARVSIRPTARRRTIGRDVFYVLRWGMPHIVAGITARAMVFARYPCQGIGTIPTQRTSEKFRKKL
jgi:hypothetical protein